ncbi:MAG: hypothetical protein PHV68_03670 [Candidatus Gastranaerophilales bacterium]|nr:hypothetical protein [Candidatus Gastranaerophilales bacterium]
MDKIKIVILIMALSIGIQYKASAYEPTSIDWMALGLSQTQQLQICKLDEDWAMKSGDLKKDLQEFQKQLRILMKNPNSLDKNIKETQWQIFIKQQQLQYEAVENFLAKRRLLNYNQRIKLHKMISEKY